MHNRLPFVLGALVWCLALGSAVAEPIDIQASGQSAIGAVVVADGSPAQSRATLPELSWRLGFNGMLAPRDTSRIPESFVRSVVSAGAVDWKLVKTLDATLVVAAQWRQAGDGLELRLRAWQQGAATAIFDGAFKGAPAHTDEILDAAAASFYREILGAPSPFGDVIYYQKRDADSRTRELAKVRLGTSLEQRVTMGQRIVLKPRSSSDGSRFLFIGYANAIPEIWQLDVRSGKLDRPVPDSAPAYGAVYDDGGAIYFAQARGRYSELVKYSAARREVLQPANAMNLGIDLRSKNGPYVFGSDRFGNPHLFLAEGSVTRRLTVDGEYNAAPRLSPDGKWVAFARRDGGRFSIWAMPADQSAPARQLTDDLGSDEDPAWSNDGRTVYFSSNRGKNGSTDIYAVDLFTRKLNRVTSSAGDERMPEVQRKAP